MSAELTPLFIDCSPGGSVTLGPLDGQVLVQGRHVTGADRYLLLALDGGQGRQVLAEAGQPSFAVPDTALTRVGPTAGAGGELVWAAFRGEEQLEGAPVTVTDEDPKEKVDIEKKLAAMVHWHDLCEPRNDDEHISDPVTKAVKKGSKWWLHTTRDGDVTRTPKKVFTFARRSSVLWPSGLVQGAGVAEEGRLDPLPITDRTGTNVWIDAMSGMSANEWVEKPSSGSVHEAIRSMVQGVELGSAGTVLFEQREMHSAHEALLHMGISAHYLGVEARASLDVEHTAERHTVLAFLMQDAFSVGFDLPKRPDEWFTDDFTNDDYEQLEESGQIGKRNPPLYVQNVDYGRMLLFSCSSSQSVTEIKAALQASYNRGIGGAKGEIDAKYKQLLQNSDLKVLAIGGHIADVQALIRSGKVMDYFSDRAIKMDDFSPMAFKLRTLWGNVLAEVSETGKFKESSFKPCKFTFQLDGLYVWGEDKNGQPAKMNPAGTDFGSAFKKPPLAQGDTTYTDGGDDYKRTFSNGLVRKTLEYGNYPARWDQQPVAQMAWNEPTQTGSAGWDYWVPPVDRMVGKRVMDDPSRWYKHTDNLWIRWQYRWTMIEPPVEVWPDA
ncbi:thiol-activated cytolysin family protein [Streptomyces sp. WAC 06783]|uniref:thiol-activated cytolysin family protein n=1 Tax=Streptomyces sp. WAC 06783 TaxID=2203211 RepID=UPI00163D27AB|nr:thiol-activated cytolysin family protein [Streptomyces sp. WAC 06783]